MNNVALCSLKEIIGLDDKKAFKLFYGRSSGHKAL